MYKHLVAMLLPFISINFGDDGGGGAPMPEATPEPVAPAPETTADQESEESKPEKTFSQAELDEILQKRLAKERRKLQQQANLEAENRILKEKLQQQDPPKPTAPDGKPTPDKFGTYEEYLDALTDWKIEERQKKVAAEREAETAKQREANTQKRWSEGVEKAREKLPDYDDVLDQDLAISRPMMESILDSDVGPEIAYYLGKNPAEAQRIAGLGPIAAAREIGKIELKLERQSSEPEKSNAPKPPPSSGSRGQVEKSPAEMSDAEFAKWRQKFIKAR